MFVMRTAVREAKRLPQISQKGGSKCTVQNVAIKMKIPQDFARAADRQSQKKAQLHRGARPEISPAKSGERYRIPLLSRFIHHLPTQVGIMHQSLSSTRENLQPASGWSLSLSFQHWQLWLRFYSRQQKNVKIAGNYFGEKATISLAM